jgi:hypothetical protein
MNAPAIQPWVIEAHGGVRRVDRGSRSPCRRDRHLFLRHGAKVERALPGAVPSPRSRPGA